MAIQVSYFTDPVCHLSWGIEPAIRRLMVEFGDHLCWTYVMGGLARDLTVHDADHGVRISSGAVYSEELTRWSRVRDWLEVADRTDAPLDPRLWIEGSLSSTYPACMAVKAAAEQAVDGGYRYLRALREGIFCFRRKLDATEALVEEARGAGLDVSRFRLDLASNAITEAFAADLERIREIPDAARAAGQVHDAGGHERLTMPALRFDSDGDQRWVFGAASYDDYRAAAEALGAARSDEPAPGVEAALKRFGRMTTPEVQAVCNLPGPRAPAELWRLAADWVLRPLRVLTGYLWELA